MASHSEMFYRSRKNIIKITNSIIIDTLMRPLRSLIVPSIILLVVFFIVSNFHWSYYSNDAPDCPLKSSKTIEEISKAVSF